MKVEQGKYADCWRGMGGGHVRRGSRHLVDRQGLASTAKDAPWNVSMTEIMFSRGYGHNKHVMAETVFKSGFLVPWGKKILKFHVFW